jgi:hypothetical protein
MIAFRPKELQRIIGVRAASRKTNRASFCGVVPWFDLENLMGASKSDGTSFEGIIEFESLLEHDFLVLTRSDGITTEVRPQPRKVDWFDLRSRKWRVHIPDFAVVRRGCSRPIYVQVKPKVKAEALAEELGLITDEFHRQKLLFEVWTEVEIRRQPVFGNAEMLFEHCGPREDVEALDQVREVLRDAPRTVRTIAEIKEASGIGGRTLGAVLRLHVLREVALDLEKPIDDRALVRSVRVIRDPAAHKRAVSTSRAIRFGR